MIEYSNFTPEELNNFIAQDIQRRFEIKDSKLVTSGPLSILVNTMSNILFDAKQYYHFITRELNVATAQRFNSMLFHSTIYNYNIKLALPAHAEGYIAIPKPNINNNQEWRATIRRYTSIIIDNIPFRIKDDINIKYSLQNGTEAIYNGEGVLRGLETSISIDAQNQEYILVKITSDMVEQVSRVVQKFIVPKYNEGENVSYDISFSNNDKLYSLKLFVNDYDNPELDLYQLEYVPIDNILVHFPQLEMYEPRLFKFTSQSHEKVMFVNYYDDYQGFSLTLGNGVYGKKLNFNDEVIVVAEVSKGDAGNITESQGRLEKIDVAIIDTLTNNTISTYQANYDFLMTSPARGGQNADDIETIRFNILKNFTERKSLITPLDYQKYFGDKYKLATAVSKQLDIGNNRVIVYKEFRNPYDGSIIDSYTQHIPFIWYMNEIVNDRYIMQPESGEYFSPFVYIYLDQYFSAYYLKRDIEVPLSRLRIVSENQLVPQLRIVWDPSIQKFKMVGAELSKTTSSGTQYFEYLINCNYGGDYYLTHSNNYEMEFYGQNLVNGRFATEPVIFNVVKIRDPQTGQFIHEYSVIGGVEVMSHVQDHYIFFDKDQKQEDELNNIVQSDDHYKYILYCPYIHKSTFESLESERKDFVGYFLDFFKIRQALDEKIIPYNIHVNQTFPDTINVNLNLINDRDRYVIENENIDDMTGLPQLRANYGIDIEIRYNANELNISGLSISDLEVAIKLIVTDYLFKNEGIDVKIYRTDLIKEIENAFPKIINDVTINSPKTLVVQSFDKYLSSINAPASPIEYTIKDILYLHPTYFHFGYNSMILKFVEEKQQN